MSTRDNAPPPADWVPCVGNRCAGCDASANLCVCISALPGEQTCCNSCTHATTALPEPLVWHGDNA